MTSVVVLAALMIVFDLAFSGPQAWRTWRLRDATGLSSASVLSGLTQYLAWCLYAASQAATGLLVSCLVGTAAALALVAAAARAGLGPSRGCVAPLSWLLVNAAAVSLDLRLAAVTLAVGSLITALPAVHSAWTQSSISGISESAWLLRIGNGALYGALGIAQGVLGGVLYAVVAIGTSVAVLAATRTRTSARRTSTLEALEPAHV